MQRIAYIKGIKKPSMVEVVKFDPSRGNIVFNVPGNNNLENFGVIPKSESQQVWLIDEDFQMNVPDILINCIADPEHLETKLKDLEGIIDQLKKQKPSLKIINKPADVEKTRRHDIAAQFKSLKGCLVPTTIRVNPTSRRDMVEIIKKEKIELPILIREAGTHQGKNLLLLENLDEASQESLDRFAFDGRNFFVTKFVEYKSADSYYRKIRIVMIGGKPYLRHQIVSKNWNIHSRSRNDYMLNNEALKADEKAFLERGIKQFSLQVLKDLKHIGETLGLEVFGIDCSLLPDGRLLVFEINPSMEFIMQDLKSYPYLELYIDNIKQAFRELFGQEEKFTI